MSKIEISFIIPVHNEAMNLIPLWEQLNWILGDLNRSSEVIFIDDGSSDGSWSQLKDLKDKEPWVSIIRFESHYGQTAALACGFKLARGETVVTMDADLQTDPRDIKEMLSKINEGYDVVVGWRIQRQDPFFHTVLPSLFGNAFLRSFWRSPLHDIGCPLKVYKKKVVKDIMLFGEMHRFIPLLIDRDGYRMTEMKIAHFPRTYGRSHYGLSRLLRIARDLATLLWARKDDRQEPVYIIQEQLLGGFWQGSKRPEK